MSEQPLNSRVILVTGAGGGLGSAVARAAADAGATLILAGPRQRTLIPVYDAIVAAGNAEPALFPIDFSKAPTDAYQALADGIAADFGRLDGIAHLAARFDALTPLANLAIEEWQRSLHVNLTAPFAVTQGCLPLLQAAPDASVVFAADAVGREAEAFWGAYAMAKSGLDTLVATFAREHGHRENLRFNAVDPGPLATPLRGRAFPTGDDSARDPEIAVPLLLHLLGPDSRGTTGRTLRVVDPDDAR